MMQQLKRLILAVFALTMLSWRAEADGVRLFETEAGVGYSAFHQKMVDADCVEGGRYDVSCLAEEAYTKVVETGAIKSLPASNQTMASYTKLFAKWNDLESTISPAFFQKKGLGTGFWSPTAPKPTMVEVVEKTAQEPTAVLSSMLDEVTRLKEQVATLTTQVENLQLGDPALAEGIEDSVALVEEKVAALAATTEATDAKFLEEFASLLGAVNLIKQQLQDYQQMTDEQMANLKREVAQGIAGAQAPIDSRINNLESALAELKIAVAGKADTTVVDALAATVAQNKAEAAKAAAALETEFDGRLATVEESIKDLSASIDAKIATKLEAEPQAEPQGYLSLGQELTLLAVIVIGFWYVLSRVSKKASNAEVAEITKTSKAGLDRVIADQNKTDDLVKGLEKTVGMLYEVHLEESGRISDLPTKLELETKKVGDIFEVSFNGGADRLSFTVVSDRQHADVRLLQVGNWPKDWSQKRSPVGLRPAAIVALVKEYNVKKGVPKPTANIARSGKEKVVDATPTVASQVKAVS